MSLKIAVEKRENGVHVIAPEGSIDSDTYMDLQKRIQSVIGQSPRVIIFDMKDVEYVSSMGIGTIFTAKKNFEKRGGTIMMVNLQPQIKKVFEIVAALPNFNIFASIEEADDYLMRLEQEEKEKSGN